MVRGNLYTIRFAHLKCIVRFLVNLQSCAVFTDGGNVGSGADSKERILEMISVQKGSFIRAQGQASWGERAALGL